MDHSNLMTPLLKKLDICSKETLSNFVLNYTTNETLKKYIKNETYINSLTTAITMSYLKVHASNNESAWSESYKKARAYLKKQINDDALEEEIIRISLKFVVDKSTKKVIYKKKKAEKREVISEVHKIVSVEKAQSVASKQNKDGSFELSDTINKDLNINNETLKVTVNTLTTKNEKVKKAPISVWYTAISLNYLKLNADSLGGEGKDI